MPDPNLDDARLGHEEAIEGIYRALHPGLLAYLRGRGAADPEDLAADVFLELARLLPTFEGDWSGLRGLAFTIARRRLSDQRRRFGRRRTDAAPLAAMEPYLTEADGSEQAGARDAVRRLVAGLPPDQAEVILLRVVAQLSVGQTAAIVGKRPGAVRALQLRGLRRLARTLADEEIRADP